MHAVKLILFFLPGKVIEYFNHYAMFKSHILFLIHHWAEADAK